MIRRDWRLAEVPGYVATWSAVRRLHEAGCFAVLACLWGDPVRRRAVAWLLAMRLGRV